MTGECMRRIFLTIFFTMLLMVMLPAALCAEELPDASSGGLTEVSAEDPESELSEWTILFYFCGSDLESSYGYATENLREIKRCFYPATIMLDEDTGRAEQVPIEDIPREQVNILIETGGSKEWHCSDIGMDVDTRYLQRWQFHIPTGYTETGRFSLEESVPLASMAAPETLTDFIKWGAEKYPAKKYGLVLWDHGGGSKTGLFIDELFANDIMYLNELGDALDSSGVILDTLLFDACLMANIDTAYVVRNSARWMVASEEMVPGLGTGISDWLEELIINPDTDGRALGRCICDMTKDKYTDSLDLQAREIMTWSVIDLSKIDAVAEVCEEFFGTVCDTYLKDSYRTSLLSVLLMTAEKYGTGREEMRDIASIFYSKQALGLIDIGLRNRMLSAIDEAVVYCVSGVSRSSARGLSFCYAASFTNEELDIYANNCVSPSYLSFLDAVTPWTAPDWVYEVVPRLPQMNTRDEYKTIVEKRCRDNGIPGYFVTDENFGKVSSVNYKLYWLDEENDRTICYGKTNCRCIKVEDGWLWSAIEPMHWPSIEGVTCCIDVVSITWDGSLYNIPVQIGTDDWIIRCGRQYNTMLMDGFTSEDSKSEYIAYGLWEGYDDESLMPNRNVKSFSQIAGQEFQLLYPVEDENGNETGYAMSQPLPVYRVLDVKEEYLPAGTYYLEYEIGDMVNRPHVMERVELYWDGENFSFPEGFTWEGTVVIK